MASAELHIVSLYWVRDVFTAFEIAVEEEVWYVATEMYFHFLYQWTANIVYV